MYLLDTDTLIYSLKGHEAVVQNLKVHQWDSMKISVITLMEIYYGAYKSEKTTANLAKVRHIEQAFTILPLDAAIAETFGTLKAGLEFKGTPLDDFDLAIAACAMTHNLTLVTNDERHFNRVEGLKLANWIRS